MKLNKVFKKNVEDTNRIRQKAYELAEKRGFRPGHEWDDWFEAERSLAESKNNPKEPES